jgi:hypothetical protein
MQTPNMSQEKEGMKYRFCSSTFFFNSIQNYRDRILIFDTRNEEDVQRMNFFESIALSNQRIKQIVPETYGENCFQCSINNIPPILSLDENKKFSKRKRCFNFIIAHHENFSTTFIDKVKDPKYNEFFDDVFEVKRELLLKYWDRLESKDERVKDNTAFQDALNIYGMLVGDKVRETYILFEGADHFFQKYSFFSSAQLTMPKSNNF